VDFMNFDYSVLIRLVVAVIFGGLIGLERGGSRHEAGLRTHIVLCIGSATVMIVSEALSMKYGSDVMRMGAQVISGVGFLGAGSIIVHGSRVKGITTAAGLWTTACIGLAIGSGLYVVASVVVVLMLLAMWGLRPITSMIRSRAVEYIVKIDIADRAALKEIFHKLIAYDVRIQSVVLEEHGGGVTAILEIIPHKSSGTDNLAYELMALEGVSEVTLV